MSCTGDREGLAAIDHQGNDHMVVPPQPAINNVMDPLRVSKMSISDSQHGSQTC